MSYKRLPMQTCSTYQGIAIDYKDQTEQVVALVREAYPVEQLYLLGLTVNSRRTESLFSAGGVSAREVSHYYLLSLVEKDDAYTINCIQDKIEGRLQHYIPVTTIVMAINEFNKWLLKGHVFANSVLKRAQKLYDSGKTNLTEAAEIDEALQRKDTERVMQQASLRPEEFLAGAELYCLRKQYKMAAFMLHQAAEQALQGLLIVHTGLRVNTHSIDKLVRYCSMFDYRLPAIFSRRTEQDRRLFGLLQKAYIDARYKEDYTISYDEVCQLTERVKEVVKRFTLHF